MKWLIRGVGMLTVLFAVSFFLLVADKLYYQNSMATYAGNARGVSDFTVNISESGVYSIIVEAHHAKGRVHIQQKGEKKDAH